MFTCLTAGLASLIVGVADVFAWLRIEDFLRQSVGLAYVGYWRLIQA